LNTLKTSIFAFLLLTCITCYAQQLEIDSLQIVIKNKESATVSYESDTTYINAVNELAHQFITVYVDSTYALANKAFQLSTTIDYANGIANSLLHLGIYYSEKGKSGKALKNYTEALAYARKGNNFNLIFDIKNNRGIEYHS